MNHDTPDAAAPHPHGGWEYTACLIAASISLWLRGDGALALKRSSILAPRLAPA